MLGCLVLGLRMALIYPKGYSGGSPAAEGLRFGLLVGLLWLLPHSLVLFGVYQLATGTLVVVDALWHLVEVGVEGMVYGRASQQAVTAGTGA